jgi:3-hydroxy-9,10-secoandrosta-1,3,5(10)-triene-9,17-dione monooxygenase reductase component
MTKTPANASGMSGPVVADRDEQRNARIISEGESTALTGAEEHPGQPVTKDQLRQVMGHYVTGAAIITAVWDGQRHGLAVNSLTSVSLEPPLILFCPDKRSSTWPAIHSAGQFVVNILGAEQEGVCRTFAKKGVDRFADVEYSDLSSGSPLLHDIVGHLECRLEQVHDAGDHWIAVGRVLTLGLGEQLLPLVFYKGGYHRLALDDDDYGDGDQPGQIQRS